MKAKQQKSGRWQARYVDHYKIVNGKKKPVLGCVTADTEREAVREAIKREKTGSVRSKVKVGYAIEQYLKLKKPVLSPTTYRSYKSLSENAFDDISSLTLSEATGARLQEWVSEYSADHSPKSVRNAHGLLSASLRMFDRNADLTVTKPQPKPPALYTPTDADIQTLIKASEGQEIQKAIILAAFGTLRRSEVAGLTYDDIEGNKIRVRSAEVEKDGGGVIKKTTKTEQSTRTVTLPQEAMEIILRDADGGKVVKMTPTAISNAFPRLLKKCGLPPFRFHDLRAYSASVRHAIGIPDQYIMRDGGWKSDRVLKQIYRRTMADKEEQFESKINDHIAGMLK